MIDASLRPLGTWISVLSLKNGYGNGAPGGIRTPDLQLRRLPLYPSELQARDSSLP